MAFIEMDKYQTNFFRTQVQYNVLEKPENSGILEWLRTFRVPRKDCVLNLNVSELAKYEGLVQYLIHAYESKEKEERKKESKSPNNFTASEHEHEMYHAQDVQKVLYGLLKV
ncbi:hypothetical protein [Brazilian marseillevirus]|uniref:hypothetical protein n=1 Tax=Brazilian marseillevirus TaxID=1813599 RepID=UPI000782A0D4|nr:hypothetical protein A3303_gp127 [Brazilian marseillevirus]AMQ10635.1 hypothetical protein [Brazilian marseillevirus]